MMFETASLLSLETLRGLGTVLAFVAFIAICLWAYSRNRRADFDQAANLPFADEIDPQRKKPSLISLGEKKL